MMISRFCNWDSYFLKNWGADFNVFEGEMFINIQTERWDFCCAINLSHQFLILFSKIVFTKLLTHHLYLRTQTQ